MKLFKIWQTVNNGYDTYDSAVVCAYDENAARQIHPRSISAGGLIYTPTGKGIEDKEYGDWTCLDNVQCEYIGEARPGKMPWVIVVSFNAG